MSKMNPKPIPQPLANPIPEQGMQSDQTAQEAGATSSVELDHLEQINISDELETANEAASENDGFSLGDNFPKEEELLESLEPSLLTEEQFYEMFSGTHSIMGGVFRLQSVAIAPNETQSARAASDAIYEVALEVPAFRFLIEPSNVWLQRAAVIAAYAFPKAQMIKHELQARKAQPAEVENEAGKQ